MILRTFVKVLLLEITQTVLVAVIRNKYQEKAPRV